MKVAYVMSRFPKLTETFVLYEILALETEGIPVEIYPLLRERQSVEHPEAARLVQRAHYHPFLSLAIVQANLHYLLRHPFRYLKLILEILTGTCRSLNFFIGALGIFPKAVRFAREMAESGVDHVHAHFATHPAVASLIVHRLTGIPFSFTAHGSDLHVDRTMLDRKVKAAKFAVTVSGYNRNVMIEECGEWARDKVRVVHCGVDPAVFSPSSRGDRDETLQILCVASFEEVKGHRYLIDACGLLRDRGTSFTCHFVGDGPLRKEIEARIRLTGLQAHVLVHGPLPRSEVAALLSRCHVIALPSVPTTSGKREGIPVALMEGMATGLPAVSSDLSGIPELVDHGLSGFLVAPRDVTRLADALQRLARDPDLRERMGHAGREKVLEEFDLHRNAGELVRLFVEESRDGKPESKVATWSESSELPA